MTLLNLLPARPANRLQGRGVAPVKALVTIALLSMSLAGCSFLKPVPRQPSYCVLSPISGAGAPTPGPGTVALGLGKVKFPAYLVNSSVVISTGPNEVEHLPFARWGERLDTGFERVLRLNLASILNTPRVYAAAWDPEDVAGVLYLTVERFEVDTAGLGTLLAHWRLEAVSEGGRRESGTTRLTRQGPSPDAGGAAVAATLSGLIEDLSRRLAETVSNSAAP